MLAGCSLSSLAVLMALGIALDLCLGEPRRWHPLVGFGRLAAWLETRLNAGRARLVRGMLAWSLAVLPFCLCAWWGTARLAVRHPLAAGAAHAVLLYLSLGLRSLRDHVLPIAQALDDGDLPRARQLTARIVSRDTAQADAPQLAKAAVESTLENGNDAVFGTLFWFLLAGGPGALLFRFANTLDAMWGYRTPRFAAFGCAAARLDDLLNLVPARLTALSYAMLGDSRRAWRCWRAQAPAWTSPNAGPVMAAGAGALGLALGGAAVYDGIVEQRPLLGAGRPAEARDIHRAWRLVASAVCWWMLLVGVAGIAGAAHA